MTELAQTVIRLPWCDSDIKGMALGMLFDSTTGRMTKQTSLADLSLAIRALEKTVRAL